MSAVDLINRFGKQTRIERPVATTDTGGGQDYGEPPHPFVTYEKVWIQPTSADQQRTYGGDYDSVTHDGFCRTGSFIRSGDELVQDGQRYKMLGFYNAGNIKSGAISHKVMALKFTEGVT